MIWARFHVFKTLPHASTSRITDSSLIGRIDFHQHALFARIIVVVTRESDAQIGIILNKLKCAIELDPADPGGMLKTRRRG